LLSFDLKEIIQVVGMDTALLDIKIDKKKSKKCVIKDVQYDPVTSRPIHLDIMGVKLKEKITVTVPIHIVGEAKGVKEEGGVLNVVQHDLEITCLPLDMPEHITVDVSELKIGDAIYVKDIDLENVELLSDPEGVVVNVITSRATVEEEKAEEEIIEEEGEEAES
jgi:large subunit ribosomal protein L25